NCDVIMMMINESGSKSGLKRELPFALQVQSELPSSLGRTQSNGNVNPSNGIIEYTRKRFKKSGGKIELTQMSNVINVSSEMGVKNDLIECTTEEEPKSSKGKELSKEVVSFRRFTRSILKSEAGHMKDSKDVLSCPSEEECRSLMSVEETQNDVKNVSSEGVNNNLSGYTIGKDPHSSMGKELSNEVVLLRRFTRSALKSEGGHVKEKKDVLNCPSEEECGNNVKSLMIVEEMENSVKNVSSEVGVKNNADLSRNGEELKDNIGKELSNEVVSFRRFTRSSLKSEAVQKRTEKAKNDLIVSPVVEEPKSSNMRKELSNAVSCRRFTRSALKCEVGPMKDNDGVEKAPREIVICLRSLVSVDASTKAIVPRVMDVGSKVQDVSKEAKYVDKKSPRELVFCLRSPNAVDTNNGLDKALTRKSLKRLTKSALKLKSEQTVMIVAHDTSSVEPPRRFTRSALTCKSEAGVMDENSKEESAPLKKPMRQLTRSALNLKDEPMGMLSTATPCGTIAVFDDAHNNEANANICKRATDVASSIRTPLHKKLEMKMSKKITLTKFPTKISELLETGMLEGLSVSYIFRGQQKAELRGIIKNRGIMCSCALCKGRKVVTPIKFEQHAGSTNKKPAYYLYLDNGNSLHDVLNACKDAPLDMLEAKIQLAINSSPVKKTICLNCKRPIPVLWMRKKVVLCSSCLKSNKSHTSPACKPSLVSRLKPDVTPKDLDDASKCSSPQKNSKAKLTRKDLRLHKLVFEEDGLPDGTELAYYVRGKKLLEGYKKGFGIYCFCCNSEISPSQFEAHAGWATRRKPYLNIYTSNGVSLHELSISLSKGRKFSANDNDDLCGICGDFGDLLLCDACPRSFHKDLMLDPTIAECVGQLSVPRGKWYCPSCQNMFVKDQASANNANAKAAGRVAGVDPIEQITKRCIRIVKTPETEVGGCTLCRIPGFSKSSFGPRTIILCDQCEKEFHVGCLRDHNVVDLKELPEGKWFCSRDCKRINCALQKCVLRGAEKPPDYITKIIKVKREETNSNLDIRWRLLSGKVDSLESRSLLSKAVAIFHNRFDPIVDAVTGRDLIPRMVYGRSIRDQDFGGMFCAVLTVNSSVVSAGLLRILGKELAELPLVATSSDYQGQGCFQSLFSCIESYLAVLNVKNIVLPAAEEAEAIWTNKFGFQKMSLDQVTNYTKDYQMTIFKGTPMLHKPVCKVRATRRPTNDN
ncbi:hypothetical protein IFM89_028814, partial [Coptis chinensis]